MFSALLIWNLAAAIKRLHQPALEIHHFDQGKQYASKAYIKLLHDAGAQINMAEARQQTDTSSTWSINTSAFTAP